MLRGHLLLITVLACANSGTSALAQDVVPDSAKPAAAKPLEQTRQRPAGYLNAATLPDSVIILPPPPAPGSQAAAFDRSVFLSTRKLQGGPRWALATRDAVETPQAILNDFSCALGIELDAQNAPRLSRLLSRVHSDAGAITTLAKDRYKRPRPFIGNDQPICVQRDAYLVKSPSYPSGHTTASWSFGLILAELAPDRATEVLARARAYGESRVVCGVHNVSDVEEGRTNGSSLVAALHDDPQFRADLEAVRQEVAADRARDHVRPSLDQCRIEDDAATHTPWLP